MRIPSQIGYVLTGTATLALLAGCGGGGAGTPSGGSAFVPTQSIGGGQTVGARAASTHVRPFPLSNSVLRPDVQKLHVHNPGSPITGFISEEALKPASTTIFVSDAANNVVDELNASGKIILTLTGFEEPQGLTTDKTGQVAIADTENSAIKTYSKPYKKYTQLSDPGQYPADVDIDSKGDYGVTNIISTSGGAGSVSFYLKGSKTPKTLSSSNLEEAFFGAFDAKGNFYFDGFDENFEAAVFEVVGGAKGTKIAELTGTSLEFPGGVQVTKKGDIAVDDQEGPSITTYKPPVGGKLTQVGSPTSLSGSSDPVSYAFTSAAKTLYTADAGLAASLLFNYPAGGSATKTLSIPNSEPIGVGVVPYENP